MVVQVLLTLCGIWSLDFFHSIIPPFCVSSNIKTVGTDVCAQATPLIAFLKGDKLHC